MHDIVKPTEARAWRSALYECRVMHHRLAPKEHRFEYGIFLWSLDIDELDELSARLRLFARNSRGLYSFHDDDHSAGSGKKGCGVRAGLEAWLRTRGVRLPEGSRIRLVTMPRVFGYVFNPVSFYFVEEADGTPLFSVAEVGNTFGEQKTYMVPRDEKEHAKGFRAVVPKHFYVSPFSDLDVRFDFKLATPGETLRLSVNDVTGDGETMLVSLVTGQRRDLTDRELARLTLRYPLVTLRVIGLIHWNALRLWWKKVPYHAKAANPGLQRDVSNPHEAKKRS